MALLAASALALKSPDALGAEPAEPGGPAATGPVTPPIELRHDLRIDLPVTAALAASVVTVAVAGDDLQGSGCRWCDGSGPGDVNGIDDAFRGGLRRADTTPANVMSHVLAFGVAPATGIFLTALASTADRREDGLFVDLALVTEGVLSATLVSEVTQRLVLRERPYAHAIRDAESRAEFLGEPEALRSFPSVHTTTAFAVAASAGTVATMRGYRLAPVVWAAGLMVGVAVGYTRIAADREYLTDALGGTAVGLIVGGGVPYLFHRPRAGGLTLTTGAVPGGRVVGLAGTF